MLGRPPDPENRRARVEAVLRAAAALFAEKGLARTTMRDICAGAGISPGALYRYFPGKEDILRALAAEEARDVDALVAALEAGPDVATVLDRHLDDILDALLDPLTARLTLELSAQAMRDDAVAGAFRDTEERLRAALVEALRRDAERAGGDLDPAAGAELILATVEGLTVRAALGAPPDRGALATTLRAVIARLAG